MRATILQVRLTAEQRSQLSSAVSASIVAHHAEECVFCGYQLVIDVSPIGDSLSLLLDGSEIDLGDVQVAFAPDPQETPIAAPASDAMENPHPRKKLLFYFHGLDSSPNSEKVRRLQEAFPNDYVYAFPIDIDPDIAMAELNENISNALSKHLDGYQHIIFIGTSLGAWWAAKMGEAFHCDVSDNSLAYFRGHPQCGQSSRTEQVAGETDGTERTEGAETNTAGMAPTPGASRRERNRHRGVLPV